MKNNLIVIAAHEFRALALNPLAIIVLIAILACLYLSGLHAAESYHWHVERFEDVSAPREEAATANLFVTAIAAPRPLHVIAKGTSDILNRPVFAMRQLEVAQNMKYNAGQQHRQQELVYSLVLEADPLFVMKMLLPLFSILIGYRFISGERQTGTLKLILANSVGRLTVLTAKLLAGATVLFIAAVLVLAVLLTVFWQESIPLRGEDFTSLLLVIASSYLYSLCFLALASAVSTSVKTNHLSVLICLMIWCLLVIVFPGAAAGTAEILIPAPPSHLIYAKKLAMERSLRGGDADERPEEEIRETNKEIKQRFAEIESEFFNNVSRQESMARSIGALSPVSPFDGIVTAFSGSSIAEEHELLSQVGVYFERIAEFDQLEAELLARKKGDDLPGFTYKPLPKRTLFSQTAFQWLILVAQLSIVLFYTYRRFNRYDVRS